MVDGGHRQNRRHKPIEFRSLHNQVMPQHQMKDHPALKIIALMAEQDSAIQECDLAISQKTAPLADRDMAMHERDAAIAERDDAIMERDDAIAGLQYAHEKGINGFGKHGCHLGVTPSPWTSHSYQDEHLHAHPSPPQLADAPFDHIRQMHISDAYPISAVPDFGAKQVMAKKTTSTQATPPKRSSNSPRKSKKGCSSDLNKLASTAKNHVELRGQEMARGKKDVNKVG